MCRGPIKSNCRGANVTKEKVKTYNHSQNEESSTELTLAHILSLIFFPSLHACIQPFNYIDIGLLYFHLYSNIYDLPLCIVYSFTLLEM